MCEIKFRAWDKEIKRIVGVQYLYENGDTQLYTKDFSHLCKECERYIPDRPGLRPHNTIELMQYTGLKDKNGVEIYEGDIIRHHKYECVVSVYWQQESCGFCLKSGDGVKNMFLSGLCTPNIEIIGNIYEHPHLLENK